ncbi:hypothetical protein CKAH01_18122 [Colletotrichum kahawae]|uniref:Uncharacterized protein n=1 Tax=Colletotrichum kahawae TaxID=34407 RepID=A0AAE0D3C8_COLKA|nr:hypothetical protein CKAH01_18122 [Colletotrichum kahawae]
MPGRTCGRADHIASSLATKHRISQTIITGIVGIEADLSGASNEILLAKTGNFIPLQRRILKHIHAARRTRHPTRTTPKLTALTAALRFRNAWARAPKHSAADEWRAVVAMSLCTSAKMGKLGPSEDLSRLGQGLCSTVFEPVYRSPMFWGAWPHPKHWPDRDGLVCDLHPPAISHQPQRPHCSNCRGSPWWRYAYSVGSSHTTARSLGELCFVSVAQPQFQKRAPVTELRRISSWIFVAWREGHQQALTEREGL